MQIYPAHAGINRCGPYPIGEDAYLPRTRGDKPVKPGIRVGVPVSTPHTRG